MAAQPLQDILTARIGAFVAAHRNRRSVPASTVTGLILLACRAVFDRRISV
jgi:hypothetical protein